MLIGGYADAALNRAATVGHGYVGGNIPFDRVATLTTRLRGLSSAAGKDPDSLAIVTRKVVKFTRGADGKANIENTAEQEAADIERYRAAGLTELFIDLNMDPAVSSVDSDPDQAVADTLALMERLAPGKPGS
ncbi:MAG: hypothetical protein GEU98_14400 [Pseudonocardiaceae bacterium]|nr:hypothetical protein [Pseudonocardiaceae bacterium]